MYIIVYDKANEDGAGARGFDLNEQIAKMMNEQVVKMVADIAEDEKMNYYGMTHLPISPKLYKWWRKVFCRHGIHLFDEVMGTGKGDEWDHYLVCDACQLMVNIKSVDQTYVKRKYKSKGYYK